jgi:hypothetical protein
MLLLNVLYTSGSCISSPSIPAVESRMGMQRTDRTHSSNFVAPASHHRMSTRMCTTTATLRKRPLSMPSPLTWSQFHLLALLSVHHVLACAACLGMHIHCISQLTMTENVQLYPHVSEMNLCKHALDDIQLSMRMLADAPHAKSLPLAAWPRLLLMAAQTIAAQTWQALPYCCITTCVATRRLQCLTSQLFA